LDFKAYLGTVFVPSVQDIAQNATSCTYIQIFAQECKYLQIFHFDEQSRDFSLSLLFNAHKTQSWKYVKNIQQNFCINMSFELSWQF